MEDGGWGGGGGGAYYKNRDEITSARMIGYKVIWMDGWMGGRTDGRTDGRVVIMQVPKIHTFNIF